MPDRYTDIKPKTRWFSGYMYELAYAFATRAAALRKAADFRRIGQAARTASVKDHRSGKQMYAVYTRVS